MLLDRRNRIDLRTVTLESIMERQSSAPAAAQAPAAVQGRSHRAATRRGPRLLRTHIVAADRGLRRASSVSLSVQIARSGALLSPAQVYVAPGDQHLEVTADGSIRIVSTPAVHDCRPSVDVMFESVALAYGSGGVGVLLTGTGSDGAKGLRAMRGSGSQTTAQDEASCLVDAMPSAARRLNAAELSVNPHQIGRLLGRLRCAGIQRAAEQQA